MGPFLLFILFSIIFVVYCQSSIKRDSPIEIQVQSQLLEYDVRWNQIAIALKTGHEVALSRVPIQLLTFLSKVKNKIIVGEEPRDYIGDSQIIDVYTHLYDRQDRNGSLKKRSDESIPDENSIGWKSDAHKNLPAFRELYTKFPDAEWYLMIDDDTYVIKSNLHHFISRLDSSLPYYFGSATVFVGCDGVKEFGTGPEFAHGGSGILLSKAAMRLFMRNVDSCIDRYRDCWAGDVRVALCLRDAGILVQNSLLFNKDPPNDKYSFDNPCMTPITFHHLLTKQMQQLYNLERQIEDKWKGKRMHSITLADIFHGFYPESLDLEFNTDRKGWDIYKHGVSVDTPIACKKMCNENPKCMSFAYDGGRCWLKKGIPFAEVASGFTSGISRQNYVCKSTRKL